LPGAQDGDLAVIFVGGNKESWFRCDKATVCRGSKVLQEILAACDEPCRGIGTVCGIHTVLLEPSEDEPFPMPRHISDKSEFPWKSVPTMVDSPMGVGPHPTGDLDRDDDKSGSLNGRSTPQINSSKPLSEVALVAKAHRLILETLQLQPPQLLSRDIRQALILTDKVLQYATFYEVLMPIRHALNAMLSQFGKDLYAEVANNPPLWLRRAISLENLTIFRESAIHLVGGYFAWPWATPQKELPENTLRVIKAKASELHKCQQQVDVHLLCNTIQTSRANGIEPITIEEEPEGWLAVSLFREWFAEQLQQIKLVSESEDKTSTVHYKAEIYRTINKRPHTYLRCSTLEQRLRVPNFPVEPWELQELLETMKDGLARIVEDSGLLTNNLLVDVEGLPIKYLTCAEIKDEDIPWGKSGKRRKAKSESSTRRSSTTANYR
jgi:hypothetical protein